MTVRGAGGESWRMTCVGEFFYLTHTFADVCLSFAKVTLKDRFGFFSQASFKKNCENSLK